MRTAEDRRPVSVRRRTRAAGAGPQRMLLIHGLAANESLWDTCLERLPTPYEVWSAQMPWRAEGPDDWGQHAALTDWMDAALRGVPGGAEVVVAHSMSANVLLELLAGADAVAGADDPLRRYGIRALVLVSPFYRGTAEEFDWPTITHYLNDFHLIMEDGIRVHSRGRFPADLQRAMGERVRDRVGPYGWIRFFETYLRTPRLRTDRITVPCLVLGGERDFAAPAPEGAALAARVPGARLRILSGTGHFPMIEEAERFASEITDFLTTSTLPADGDPQRGPGALGTLELHR
ncbi:alpha/beta hydrolase [Streptomyces sp. NPDC048483]|uniref:alpha/beta fold hydrolase n=1 Tax=Streptomyces sp. NPDC048483 TaxID=3154927 RepID=UPI003444439B